MSQKNNYNVSTANWTMDVYVNENIFDDPHVEACTLCLENKIKNLQDGEDFLVNPVMFVKAKKRNSKRKVINTYKVLLNAGLPGRAEILRKLFYMTTSIDMAKEPLSSSKL